MEKKVNQNFDLYEFNTDGYYRMIGKTEWLRGKGKNYLMCSIKGKETKQKHYSVHRAIWETFNGKIPEKMEIDHIDKNKENNKLSNLQCITLNENRKKRNHDFLKEISKNNIKNQKNIKGINTITNEDHVFNRKNQAGKYYGCSAGLVYLICEKKNNCNTFGGNIIFEYTDEIPNNIIKDPRIGKKRVSDEEQKEKHKIAMKKYYEKKRGLKLKEV